MSIPDLQGLATGSTAPVRVEPNLRRVRVVFNAEVIADSTNTIYLFESGYLPVYYFPIADVRTDVLLASDHTTHCPRKGDAQYFDIIVGARRSEQAVWGYPNPLEGAPDIAGYVAFWWDRVDAWFEEDDEVFVHPRDPYKRVDVLQSSRHVEVLIDGVLVADTTRPRLLFETGLPVRYYIPKLDVRADLLVRSETTSDCPYKGRAAYVSVQLPDRLVTDIAWIYPAPIPEIPKIENHVCFFNERVDLVVDGVPQTRPNSPWSEPPDNDTPRH
jgi:uncharacterized protein (DUF427 family)